MKEPGTTTQHYVVLAAKVIGKASARIELCFRTIQNVGWKSLKLVAQASVKSQVAFDLPRILDVQSAIVVRSFSFRLVADGAGDSLSLEH